MKTDEQLEAEVFVQTVRSAISQLKARLQRDYARAYPDLIEIIHIVLDEEEANAWDLSPFPHLLLPNLVEAHLVKLNLQSADTKHADVLVPHNFTQIETRQSVYALGGA